MTWDLSCPDWRERLRSGRSLVPTLPLDNVRASKAVAVFDQLKLADVPGNPMLKDAAGDWFRDIVRALFGSWDPVAKERYIREVFALVAKKSSKTSYGAGLMLTALLLNERPKGKFLLVAPTQDVTELAFSQIEGMVALDSHLSKPEVTHVQTHLKRITYRKTGATLEVMSFDPSVLTGQKPTGFMLDELHVVASSHKARSAVGQLRGGMIAQPEAFGIFITTQSEKTPAGVFKAELQRARRIRDGLETGRVLPVLYEFPEDIANDKDKWRDPKHWYMVAPNAGRSITVARLVEEMAVAESLGDEELQRWASQHLNIEIGLSLGSDRWAGADYWSDCADAELTLDALIERSDVICVGVDGGGLDDLLGLAVLGRDRTTRDWLLWVHAWAHRSLLTRRKSEVGRFKDFESDGDLTIVEALPEDINGVVDIIDRINQAGLLACVGLDPIGVGAIVDALAEKDITQDGKQVEGISQGYRLQGSIKAMERKLSDGTLTHAGQPLMAWCVGNAKVEAKGNAIVITKQAAGFAKIDPLMAAFDAAALMSTNPEAPGSVYKADRGLLIVSV